MNLLAKPSGITLQEHLNDVLKEGSYIQKSFPITFKKYFQLIQKDLGKRLNGAIKFHDAGKAHPIWQNACQKDYKLYRKWSELNKDSFQQFSKKNKELAGKKNLRSSGVGHEIASLDKHFKDGFSQPVKVAIAAHHSKLSRKHENRWIDNSSGINSSKLWSEFVGLNGCFRNYHEFKEAVLKHYEFSGVRAYLELADHRASAIEDENIVLDFTPFFLSFSKGMEEKKCSDFSRAVFR